MAALFCGVVVGALVGAASSPDHSEVAFIQAGQADCTAILHNGRVVLIDAGVATQDYDLAARIVVPALRRLGVRAIDAVFVTHPHADHIGGLSSIAEAYPVGQVIVSSAFKGNEELAAELGAANIAEVVYISGPHQIRIEDLTLTILPPPIELVDSENNGSLFMFLEISGYEFAFSGDADAVIERAMIGALADWDSDVLKAGHHGSKYSSDPTWLAAVAPEYGVISAGINSQYGHPAEATLQRFDAAGATVFETGEDGTIRFICGERLAIRTFEVP